LVDFYWLVPHILCAVSVESIVSAPFHSIVVFKGSPDLRSSSRFTKTWRIRRILQSAAKFKRIKLTASDVMKPMIALLLANIIVLTVWTIVDPLEVKTETVAIDEFDRPIESKSFCRSEHQTIYLSILVVINLGSLAFSLIQAFQARKISTEFNESSYIFVAMVSQLK
jgi:gamma-aminobutyric acid type B receptor